MTTETRHGADPIRLGGTVLARKRHICAFFHTNDEQYQILLPYMKEGIQMGQKAFHIIDAQRRDEHLLQLREAGIDTSSAERSGQLEICGWEQAYLRDGHFDQMRMLALIEEVLQGGKKQGFPLTRLVANMEWALEDRPGVEDIVEYETRLNYVLPRYDDPVICTYSLTQFSANVVMDILRAHPMVLIGGILQENPFFVPPDQLLAELRARKPYSPKRYAEFGQACA